MSNQMTTPAGYAPAPVAPAPPARKRSFAGAIVLIVIGVVFLLGNMHVITWIRLWRWFAHYWPVLLILYGVVKLIEYYQAQREQAQYRGFGAGGVVMVVFLILFGLTASGIERVRGQINWNELNGDFNVDEDMAGIFGNSFTFNQELEQAIPTGATFKVISDRGSVNVTSWDENRIKVVVSKQVRADSQEEANSTDQATRATIAVNGNEVTVNANLKNVNKPASSDLQIFVPKKGAVLIDTRRGDVSVRDRDGSVKIVDSGADVSLENINGNADVAIRPAKGSFRASNVTGDITLDGKIEDTNVSDVRGNVRMTGDYFGDMNVSKVTKAVTFKSSRTDLEFATLQGEMTMQSGDLRASQVSGPVQVTTRAKDITLEDVAGNVTIQNENGSITVRPTKLGELNITNHKGDVEVTIPAKAGFQFNVATQNGDISSDFGTVNSNQTGGSSVANGTVGSGGPKVQITKAYGDVSLRKG
jgi:DUF4097 and DUF4098 domain-containing protein YvlB